MSTRILPFLAFALLLTPFAGGCGSGGDKSPTAAVSDATRDAPASLFRQWELVSVSGGIGGGGYAVTPGTNFLTFDRNGNFSRTVNGQTTQGTYRVVLRSSSLSESELPVITFSDTSLTEVVTQASDQKLTLVEEAADGFDREYEPASVATETVSKSEEKLTLTEKSR